MIKRLRILARMWLLVHCPILVFSSEDHFSLWLWSLRIAVFKTYPYRIDWIKF